MKDAGKQDRAVAPRGLQLNVAVGEPASPDRRAHVDVLDLLERNLTDVPREEPALLDDAGRRDGELVEGIDESAPSHAEEAREDDEAGDVEKGSLKTGRSGALGRRGDQQQTNRSDRDAEQADGRGRNEPHPVIPGSQQYLLSGHQVLPDVRHRQDHTRGGCLLYTSDAAE